MLIKSESGHALVKYEQVEIVTCDKCFCIYSANIKLGTYSSYTKALKVIQMIENQLFNNFVSEVRQFSHFDTLTEHGYKFIFQMPKDCEV